MTKRCKTRLTLLVTAALCLAGCEAPLRQHDWPAYLGGTHRNQYADINQINRQNVAQLRHAWTFDTGDVGQFQASPIIIDGLLYIASPGRNVFAINAATGAEVWRFDPASEQEGPFAVRQRGVVFWSEGAGLRDKPAII